MQLFPSRYSDTILAFKHYIIQGYLSKFVKCTHWLQDRGEVFSLFISFTVHSFQCAIQSISNMMLQGPVSIYHHNLKFQLLMQFKDATGLHCYARVNKRCSYLTLHGPNSNVKEFIGELYGCVFAALCNNYTNLSNTFSLLEKYPTSSLIRSECNELLF